MNKDYFRYLIRSAGYTPANFAKLLDLKLPTMNYKIRTGSFNVSEIKQITKLLEKTFEEIFNG
jgi:hypothetical protein